ncbi:MAG: hypothetical protein ACXVD1_07780 [Nocardioides sp.]
MPPHDFCERCDLPLSQCIHGMPAPAAVPEPAKAPPKPRKRATSGASAAGRSTSARPVTRRWTPPDELSEVIVELLRDAGGALPGEDLLERLGEAIGPRLRQGDEDRMPSGELRWHYAARRARQALIADGVMAPGTHEMWTLAR